MYKTQDGKAYILIEVHRVMNTPSLSRDLDLCSQNGVGWEARRLPLIYVWESGADGPIVPKEHYNRPFVKHSPPPEVPIPSLKNSGDWCGSDIYGFGVKLAPRVVIPPPAKEVDPQQFIQMIENANIKMQEFPIIDIEKISAGEREHSGAGRPRISTQENWRWCKKCQGLFFAGNPTLGVCPAGRTHDQSESGNYALIMK
jgi:hypothetical protein